MIAINDFDNRLQGKHCGLHKMNFFQILAHCVSFILCSSMYIYMMRYTRCKAEKKGLSKKAKR